MAKAEAQPDPAAARLLFEKAVAEYDLVLKTQANSIEAINNKAWVELEYLGHAQEALALAEGLLKRVDPATLPPDFYDTLGAIQEKVNRPHDAEASYTAGLKRAADHPVLNFHLGRLLALDKARARSAASYLKKAQAARGQLPPNLAAEARFPFGARRSVTQCPEEGVRNRSSS